MNELLNIVLDNDVDETIKQGTQTVLLRSGAVVEGDIVTPKAQTKLSKLVKKLKKKFNLCIEPIDTRVKYPFVVTITKDANMNTEDVAVEWVANEPATADTLELQIINLYNF